MFHVARCKQTVALLCIFRKIGIRPPFRTQPVFPIDTSQTPISGNLPFLMQSGFPLFRSRKTDRKKSTSHLVDIFGKTDRMALSVFPVEKVRAWSLHTVCLMQEPQPYRIDARGRAQAEVGFLLGLARGQAGVEGLLYAWSCGGSSHSSHKAANPAATHQGRAIFPQTETARRLHMAVQKSAVRPCINVKPSWLSPTQTYLIRICLGWQQACVNRHLGASL